MTPRFVTHRKDANHDQLLRTAKRCGAKMVQYGPLEFWCWVAKWREWRPVEFKVPEKEGHADEFTEKQKAFIAWCHDNNATYEVWRTEADVIESIGGKL